MENLQKEFVTYNQALRLKALGFNEPCLLNVWWLNDKCTITKKLFEPLISINGNDIDFEYSLPKKHPLEKWGAIDIDIPTFSQVLRFFRDKNFHVNIDSFHCIGKPKPFGLSIDYLHESGKWDYIDYRDDNDFETYEEAQSKAIDVIIEILENK